MMSKYTQLIVVVPRVDHYGLCISRPGGWRPTELDPSQELGHGGMGRSGGQRHETGSGSPESDVKVLSSGESVF